MSCIGWVILYLWSRTVRIRKVNLEIPRALNDAGKNFIYAFWHGRQFLLFHSHRNTGIVIPASESRDGEIQAQILKRFGFDVVRGSSNRKGERALLGLVDGLRKGKTIALAVDGPRGPLHEVKQGVTYLAGKL
ncbi:MAG: lysophospholipid acyltransferase family protein, partial [Nitrospirota bacterium]